MTAVTAVTDSIQRDIELLRSDVALEIEAADAARANFDLTRLRLKGYLQRIDLLADEHRKTVEALTLLSNENAMMHARILELECLLAAARKAP